jgi:hypothetical protein
MTAPGTSNVSGMEGFRYSVIAGGQTVGWSNAVIMLANPVGRVAAPAMDSLSAVDHKMTKRAVGGFGRY